MIQTALRVLIERDESLSAEIYRKEEEVNNLQIEIDDSAVKLTALQQPVGGDVRFLFMASRIATELERIGDQAINIIENAHHVIQAAPLKPLVDLPVMGEIAERMVRDSLEALVEKDCSVANRVLEEEKKVDAYRDQIFRVLLTYMMADPGTIQRALALDFDFAQPGARGRSRHEYRRRSDLSGGRAGSAPPPRKHRERTKA